jgi:hypothetical protein
MARMAVGTSDVKGRLACDAALGRKKGNGKWISDRLADALGQHYSGDHNFSGN